MRMLSLNVVLAVALLVLVLPAPTPSRAGGPATIRLVQAPRTGPTPGPVSRPVIVWVNTNSGVYHCPGDRWYGRTKQGEYMTEAEAKARGNRPDHYRPCQ